MVEEDKKNAIMGFLILIIMISVVAFILLSVATSYETRYVLIHDDEIRSYDVVDGNTVIINTENEIYEVELFNDIVDFTVSSDISINLAKGYHRSFFWDKFEPTDSAYWIDRIIKVPDTIEGDKV